MSTTHRTPRIVLRSLLPATIATALALAAAGTPAFAADTTPTPIEISSCTTVYEPSAEQVYAMGMLTPAGIEISYVNHAGIAIDEVTFRLGDGADSADVVDHGNFAPGAVIRHIFWTGSNPVAACRVAAVRLTGGEAISAMGPVMTASR